jgi:hypothetical protein
MKLSLPRFIAVILRITSVDEPSPKNIDTSDLIESIVPPFSAA